MSKEFERLRKSLKTSTRTSLNKIPWIEDKANELFNEVRDLKSIVSNNKERLDNAKVFEKSGVIDIFEGIINSDILGANKAEIQWTDSNEVVSLLFGAHDASFKDIEPEWMECLKDAYLYRCTFKINDKGKVVFNYDIKNSFQDSMNDHERCAWKRGENLSNIFNCDLREAHWCSIDDFSEGIKGGIRQTISTYIKTENINLDMQKLEEVFASTQRN